MVVRMRRITDNSLVPTRHTEVALYSPSKNRPRILAEFQRNSRSGLDSGWSPPEFRVTETRNSGFRWIPGSEFWSPADSGIRVLESGGIPGLEFCHVMAFQSRVRSLAEFRVWSSGVRLKIWGPAEFQTLVLLQLLQMHGCPESFPLILQTCYKT